MSDVLGQPQRSLDQPAPTVLIPTLDQHAIERERCLSQPMHTLRDALLGEFDTARISPRVRFHGRQLGLQKIRCPDLDPTQRAQLAGPR